METTQLLNDKINDIVHNYKINIGNIYHHYKNPDLKYKILNIGIYEATEEPLLFIKHYMDLV